ncbi:MAG: hypothetical protein M1838_002550 [Thelocarpon superellum]|nr:MAG: hypothetical protein M1838_002550 [Thelocarpon superellum]
MGGAPAAEHLLIALPFPRPVGVIEQLEKRHPHIQVTFRRVTFRQGSLWANQDELPLEEFKSATILATLSALPPTAADAPKLKVIHLFSAGSDHLTKHPIYKDSDIPITTSSGIHGASIAEWVLMTALAASHSFKQLLGWQREHHWGGYAGLAETPEDKVGKRLGVLGYGSIGRQVANVCKAMGMDVIAYTASPRTTPESKKDTGYIIPGTGDPDGTIPSAWYSGLDKASLRAFLSQDIDVLLISVPLTPATTHFLGAEEFDILRHSRQTFISNISRGAILDQPALITALKADPPLRGAALDVTDPEPLPAENELWDLPNVIITPHVSGFSQTAIERSFEVLDLNLSRLAKGEKLVNIVDRKRGY